MCFRSGHALICYSILCKYLNQVVLDSVVDMKTIMIKAMTHTPTRRLSRVWCSLRIYHRDMTELSVIDPDGSLVLVIMICGRLTTE